MSTQLSASRDGNAIGWALAGAVLFHAAALFLPVRWDPSKAPRPPAEPHVPRIVRPRLEPPPLGDRMPPRSRTIPALRELELPPPDMDIGPVPDGVRMIEVTGTLSSAPALPGAPAPPPASAVVDETTTGLRLPESLGGRTPPEYPRSAREMRVSGRVLLSAVITVAGRVDSVEVLAAPNPDLGFSAAAIESVRGWRYRPGTLGGRPVAVRLTVVVDFTLR